MSGKSKIQKIYHLSPMQEGMLFHSIYNTDDYMYFEQYSFLIKGKLDTQLFEQSFQVLIQRHDALRTIFVYEKMKVPQQIVLWERKATIQYEDVSGLSKEQCEQYIEEFKKKDKQRGFILSKDMLVRMAIIKTDVDTYQVIWSFHHIIMDGWCIGIIMKEQLAIYQSLVAGKSVQLPEPQQFENFIHWLEKRDKEKDIEYWRNYLEGYEEENRIPNKGIKTDGSYIQEEFIIQLDKELTGKLSRIAVSNDVTMSTLFQAIWGVLLQKYNDSNDVVFGTVVSGRASEIAGVESMIGLFINTIPLRIKSDKDEIFTSLLQRIQSAYFESEKNSYISLSEIQKTTSLKEHPLDHILAFENYPLDKELLNLDGEDGDSKLRIDGVETFEQTNFNFNIVVIPGDELTINFTYNAQVYGADNLEKLEGHLRQVVNQVVEKDDILLREIKILTEAEREKLLIDYNKTDMEYPSEISIDRLFEAQVAKTPDGIAVECDNRKLTYQELNEKANSLAWKLRERGIDAGDTVVILLRRSIEFIVSVLGVLKAGAAYVPIDTDYPIDRIDYIIKDSDCKAVISNAELWESVSCEVEQIDVKEELMDSSHTENLEIENKLDDLVYMIYTSGTTGKPKGVMIRHGGLVNYIYWAKHVYLGEESLNFPLYSSVSFDLTVTSIFTPLIAGSTIVIYDSEDKLELIKRILEEDKVDIVKLTPAHLKIIECLNNVGSRVRKFIVGGEDLKTDVAARTKDRFSREIEIYNEYGPTETVVGCMIHKYNREEDNRISVPIGIPAGNVQIYILDSNLDPVCENCQGEMYIAGDGVARGYKNKPELTKQKFIPNPFQPGKQMYRTGDIARWIHGKLELEYIGRSDEQVKINGFRVELGEVETVLKLHEEIRDVLVTDGKDDRGNQYLCAYYVADNSLTTDELRTFIVQSLPEYMVPAYFIRVEEFKMTINGKIDKKSLPKPQGNVSSGVKYVAPENDLEEKLCEIWSEVLGVPEIGTLDNFFSLGGDSIKAIQVVSRLQKYDLKIEIKDLLKNPTIKEAALYTVPARKKSEQGIIEGEVALTPIQKWLFETNKENSHHFNQSVMLYKEDGFDHAVLRLVLDKLVEHHDVFRMVYEKQEDRLVQYNRGFQQGMYEFTEFNFVNQNVKQAVEAEVEKIQASIDLANGPLFKAAVFKTEKGEHLLLVAHHLIIDGVSWRILAEDFSILYKQFSENRRIQLQEKTDSFKEWSKRIYEYATSKKLLSELKYWNQVGLTGVDKLPEGNPVTQDCVKNSGDIKVSLNAELTEKLLKKVNYAYNTQINDILLTALVFAVNEWTGNRSVMINLESHGRTKIFEDVSIERTIGWFTSTYPVLLQLPESKDTSLSIMTVKETLRKVPNEGIGYGILRYITPENLKKDVNLDIYPEINFNYMGQTDQDSSKGIFSMSELLTGQNLGPDCKRNYVFDINAMVNANCLGINFNYNTSRYDAESVKQFANLYKEKLEYLIRHCEEKESKTYSPSDFGDNSLTIDELQEIEKTFADQIDKIYTLSPMQEGMLFHSLYDEHSGYFCEQMTLSLKGNLDVVIFGQTIQLLMERYDSFRTIFLSEKLSSPRQVVLKEMKFSLQYIDKSEASEEEREQYIKQYEDEERMNGFTLTEGSLTKVTVFKEADAKYSVVWTFHHLIMDGWCMGIIIGDLFKIYNALLEKREVKLQRIQPYSNYIHWLEEQDKDEAIGFWKGYLEGVAEPTLMSSMERVTDSTQYLALEKEVDFDESISSGLQQFAKEQNVTMNTVIQVIWGIILGKINHSEDCVFGCVVSGRPSEVSGIETMVGLFINTIPVRIKCSHDKTVAELVNEVQTESAEALKYQFTPLNEISSVTRMKNSLIDHVIIFENYPFEEIRKSGDNQENSFTIEDAHMFEQSNYNFNIMVTPGDKINFKFLYNGNAYDEDSLLRIVECFEEAARGIIANPAMKVSQVNILSDRQKDIILNEFQGAQCALPENTAVYQYIEKNAAEFPDRIAISYQGENFTYQEVNEKSNQIAHYLIEKGLKQGDKVVLMLERSPLLAECILAVWKAGCAYIPVDISYPKERVKNILESSNVTFLLTDYSDYDKELDMKTFCIDLKLHANELEACSAENLDFELNVSSIAYVIYTSGSTGKPKGAMVEQIGMLNHILAKVHDLEINENSVIVENASQCFDISVWQFFAALVAGGKTVIYSTDLCMDVEQFVHLIEKNQITILEVVPSFLSAILDYLKTDTMEFHTLQYLVVTGEAVKPNLVRKWFACYHDIPMVNAYGPTEASDDITHYIMKEAPSHEIISVGKPIQNFSIYIVDQEMNLCPIGIQGEVCVAGIGVGRGYLNDKEKTEAAFVKNPFAGGEKSRLYKTGDLGRWMPDGNIELSGRKDYQVKVRGFRIELGEIESILCLNPGIQECVAVVAEDSQGNKKLIVYVTLDKNQEDEIEAVAIREDVPEELLKEQIKFMQNRLPEYMIPSAFIVLNRMPLTSNGKIDRKALPQPVWEDMQTEYIAPQNKEEEILERILAELLEVEQVGVETDVFELGIDSIKAIKLVSRIQNNLQVKLQIKDIFEKRTIRTMAEFIQHAQTNQYETIQPVGKKSSYKASASQRRLFALSQINGQGIEYNIPTAVKVEGKVDRERIEEKIRELISRHESLRTSFVLEDNEPVQIVHESVEFNLEYETAESFECSDILSHFVRPFDLGSASLFRAKLVDIDDIGHILLFDIHHIISDAISIEILIREFVNLYQGITLTPLSLQYKDYAEWEHEFSHSETMQNEEKYWLDVFSTEVPQLNMPTDYNRDNRTLGRGDNVKAELSDEQIKGVEQLAEKTESTLFMVLFSAFNVLLSKYAGQNDIVVGVPVSGRNHEELENIIGMFVNTVAMRNSLSPQMTFKEILMGVKENAINSFQNQDYQFDELVRKLNLKRVPGRNPIFDVMFDMYEVAFPRLEMDNVVFERYEEEYEIARFDLTLFVHQVKCGIWLTMRYDTGLYKKETIETMLEHYIEILDIVSKNVDIPLQDIKLTTKFEDWNATDIDMDVDFDF